MKSQKQFLTLLITPLLITGLFCRAQSIHKYGHWMSKPQTEWPQITMINQITYVDKKFPIGGCGFLLDTGQDTLAITAKHVLTYFKSENMNSVSFGSDLIEWKMFPKDNPRDAVIIDSLLNADPEEPLGPIPASRDWLLFSVKTADPDIQPLKFRPDPLVNDEAVYIIGWRYSDKNCPQVIYEGNLVEDQGESILISTKKLSDNTMPGLSGSPVIDSRGYLIGIMSRKAGKLERLASLSYPKSIVERMKK